MASSSKKKPGKAAGKTTSKSKGKSTPPKTNYPAAPHIIGMDWIELSVAAPGETLLLLVAMGLSPRGYAGRHPMVAIGGLVIMLKRTTASADTTRAATMTLQLTTDNITLKRQQLRAMDLKLTPMTRQPRGDMTFTWKSPDGYSIRFVGPLRD